MSRDEKERRVVDLYSQGKTYRQIAEVVRISPNDIHAILKKKEEEKNNSSVTNYQKQRQELSSKAYKTLFRKEEYSTSGHHIESGTSGSEQIVQRILEAKAIA
jgi:transposase